MALFVGYVRVSTKRQERSGLGREAQLATIRAYIEAHGGELVGEPLCETESGAHNSRPKLAEALKLCRQRGATLLIAKLDRLSRNATFLFQLQESGVDFVCCDMPGANRMTIRIMAVLAEQERELISARTKDALKAAKARGTKLGSNAHRIRKDTFGDRRGSAKGTASSIAGADSRAKDLAEDVLAFRAEGLSFAKIADRLNAGHYQTARGGKWHSSTVKNLLDRIERIGAKPIP